MQVLLQSKKQHTSHPKHTQEMQPPHAEECKHLVYTLWLAHSSSSHKNPKHTKKHVHHEYKKKVLIINLIGYRKELNALSIATLQYLESYLDSVTYFIISIRKK